MELLDRLKSGVMVKNINRRHRNRAQVQYYTSILDTLEKISASDVAIEDEEVQRSIIALLNADICVDSVEIQLIVLKTLKAFLKCKRNHFQISLIPEKYIHIALGTTRAKELGIVALECFHDLLFELIIEKNLDLEDIYVKLPKTSGVLEKFVKLVQNVCLRIPMRDRVLFFYETIIPLMFDSNKEEIIMFCGDLISYLQPHMDITYMNNDQLNNFKTNVITRYINKVTKLQDSYQTQWTLLWTTIAMSCGKMLHEDGDIRNLLLNCTQKAFNSNDIFFFSEACDCWRVYIDICSVNMEHLCNPQQISLIIAPLNIAKGVSVAQKRFQLWLYLLSILKEKSNICLEYFLMFCYGTLGETSSMASGYIANQSPGRHLWKESTSALLEIMGHFGHDITNSCFPYAKCIDFKLQRSIIDDGTYKQFESIIINAVGECSITLIAKCPDKKDLSKTITCLWGSLFTFMKRLEQMDQEISLGKVAFMLLQNIRISKEVPDSFSCILKLIINLVLDNVFFSKEILNKVLLYPLVDKLVGGGGSMIKSNKDTLVRIFYFGEKTNISWFEKAIEFYLKIDEHSICVTLFQLWIELSPAINSTLTLENDENQNEASIIYFMLWPLLHAHKISKEQKNDLVEAWVLRFTKIYEQVPNVCYLILQDLVANSDQSKVYINNTIMQLFPYLCRQIREFHDTSLVEDAIKLASSVFKLNLHADTKEYILPALKELSLCLEGDAMNNISLHAFCKCCDNVIAVQEIYDILELLVEFFGKMPKVFIPDIPESLIKNIRNLVTHENKTYSKNAEIIITRLGKKLSLSPKRLSSSSKFGSMVTVPSPKKKEDNKDIPFTFFGTKNNLQKKLDGINFKNNSSKVERKTKSVSKFNKNDIDYANEEANFVYIDNQYKFDPDKLSDHQLEVLKERSDIPALYQDLSQSQSGSQCFSKMVKGANALYVEKDSKKTSSSCEKSNILKLPPIEKSSSETTQLENISNHLEHNIHSSENSDITFSKEVIKEAETLGGNKPKRRIPLIRVLDKSHSSNNLNLKQPSMENSVQGNINDNAPQLSQTSQLDNNASLSEQEQATPPKNSRDSQNVCGVKLLSSTPSVNGSIGDQQDNAVVSNGYEENLEIEHNTTEIPSVGAPEDDVNESDTETDQEIDYRLKRELDKIKMDVVGFGDVFQNLDVSEKRRTRTSNINAHPGYIKDSLRNSNKKAKPVNSRKPYQKVKEHAKVQSKAYSDKEKLSMNGETLLKDNIPVTGDQSHKNKYCNNTVVELCTSKRGKKKLLAEDTVLTTNTKHRRIKMNENKSVENSISEDIVDNQDILGNLNVDFSRNDEDVIESSQESYLEITPLKNTSIISLSPKITTNVKESSPELTVIITPLDINFKNLYEKKCITTQEVETMPLIDTADICSPDQLIPLNISVPKVSTKDEESISEVDAKTESNDKVCGIVSSPVVADTPTRTKDFIDNTINISPIRLFSDQDDAFIIEKTPDIVEPEVYSTTTESNKEKLVEENETTIGSYNRFSSFHVSSRTTKLLKLADPRLSPKKVIKQTNSIRDTKTKSLKSAKNDRVLRMMEICKPESKQEYEDDNKEIEGSELDDSDDALAIPENHILRFVREIPSPLASPKFSILKRKVPDMADEGLSPPRKKRVNFPDPPLTLQKLILTYSNKHVKPTEKDDKPVIADKEAVAPVCESEISEEADDGEIITESKNSESQDIIDKMSCDTDNTCEDVTLAVNIDDMLYVDAADTDYYEVDPESLLIETQGSIDLAQPHLLENNQPICPDLVNCKESIGKIIKYITSPSFKKDILIDLKNKQIFTIGDLARLSEVEINRLPIISPKIIHVQDALTKFMNEKPEECPNLAYYDHVEPMEEDFKTVVETIQAIEIPECDNQINDIMELNAIPVTTLSPNKNVKLQTQHLLSRPSLNSTPYRYKNEEVDDVRTNFDKIISIAKKKGLELCLGDQLLNTVGVDVLISVLINSGDLPKDENIENLITELVNITGLDHFLYYLLKLQNVTPYKIIESCLNQVNQEEATALCELITSKLSRNEIFQQFGIDHLIGGLYHVYQDSQYSLKDLFNKLTFKFSPNVEDVSSSFQYISVVKVNDRTIVPDCSDRLQLDRFIQKVLSATEDSELTKVVPSDRILANCSSDELINALDNHTPENIMENIKMLLSKLPNTNDSFEPLMCNIIEKYSLRMVSKFVFNTVDKHFKESPNTK